MSKDGSRDQRCGRFLKQQDVRNRDLVLITGEI